MVKMTKFGFICGLIMFTLLGVVIGYMLCLVTN